MEEIIGWAGLLFPTAMSSVAEPILLIDFHPTKVLLTLRVERAN